MLARCCALVTLMTLVVLGLDGCRVVHGETTCEDGCPGDAYCSVTADRDPDGGCQFSAMCVAVPAPCAEAPSCACLIEEELAPYRDQGWADDEVFVDCDGDAASGFTVESSLAAKCLPDE
jgi:hypothetical protein